MSRSDLDHTRFRGIGATGDEPPALVEACSDWLSGVLDNPNDPDPDWAAEIAALLVADRRQQMFQRAGIPPEYWPDLPGEGVRDHRIDITPDEIGETDGCTIGDDSDGQ